MIKLTLDTNCIVNLLDFNASTPTSVDELSEIIRYALDGDINIAITTDVEKDFGRDKDRNRKDEMIFKIRIFPVIGAMTDGSGSSDLEKEFKTLLFPGLSENDKHYQNKIADVNHLVAHVVNKRDIFVTDDNDILRRSDKLKDGFGIVVMTPAKCLEYLDLMGKKEIIVQEFYNKLKEFYNLILQAIKNKDDINKNDVEYIKIREWLLRNFPKIKEGLVNFRFRMKSVPIGSQRVFNQFDINDVQGISEKFEALYKERTLAEKIETLTSNSVYYGDYRTNDKILENKFGEQLDLLMSYIGYLENN